jgi:hypothetical protein
VLHLRLVPAVDPDALEDVVNLEVEDRLVGVHRAVDAVRLDKMRDVHALDSFGGRETSGPDGMIAPAAEWGVRKFSARKRSAYAGKP